jgi:hypothetical protein
VLQTVTQGDRMRRRDFISALLLAPIADSALAQHPIGMKRMALAQPAGRVADIDAVIE